MGIVNQQMQQKFPYPASAVFEALMVVLPEVGITVKSSDRDLSRITASARMSAFSWGENMSFVVEPLDASSALVSMSSASKVVVNIVGAYRHQKNFDKVIMSLSTYLRRQFREPGTVGTGSPAPAPQAPSSLAAVCASPVQPQGPVPAATKRQCACGYQGPVAKKWDSWVVPVAIVAAFFTCGLGLLILLVPKKSKCPQCDSIFE